jgi:hypothetical protein
MARLRSPAPARNARPAAGRVWRESVLEFHRANVDWTSAHPAPAQRTDSLERLVTLPAERAREALTSLPGVGVWTAAETAQRAFGDPDALSVGDYHLAKVVGWSLLGHPIDDAAMIDVLEPMRPHRHRAVVLGERPGPKPTARRARNPESAQSSQSAGLPADPRGYTSRDSRTCEGAMDDRVHNSWLVK